MAEKTTFYRRNLPHIHPKHGTFFITFRLAGSLPKHIIEQLRLNRQIELKKLVKTTSPTRFEQEKYNLEKRLFAEFDKWLDACTEGPQWLKDKRLAKTVADKIHDLDGQRYRLLAYCIMSNHVHLVIDQSGFEKISASNKRGKTRNYILADTMRILKGSTSRSCNQQLGRTGTFWHHESYDHFVRDEEELSRIIQYVINNPVKAGIAENWQDWDYTYIAQT